MGLPGPHIGPTSYTAHYMGLMLQWKVMKNEVNLLWTKATYLIVLDIGTSTSPSLLKIIIQGSDKTFICLRTFLIPLRGHWPWL